MELTFTAGVMSIEEDGDDPVATFYKKNNSTNLNKWGVTEDALNNATPTILGTMLGIDPSYIVGKHPENPKEAGKWITTDNTNKTYLLAKAKFTDPQAWEMLKSGQIGPVSVVISVFSNYCSHCGQPLSLDYREMLTHDHIAQGIGYGVIDSFKFKRVDFVDVPAYPQAGIIQLASAQPDIALGVFAAGYVSQSNNNGLQGAYGQKPDEIRRKRELEQKIQELEAAVAALQTQVDSLKASHEAHTKDHPEPNLTARVKALEDGKHNDLVRLTLEARTKAGLTENPVQDKEFLSGLSADVLLKLRDEANRTAQSIGTHDPLPKVTYTDDEKNSMKAAEEAVRSRLFGRSG